MAGLPNSVLAERRKAAVTMRAQTVTYRQRARTTNLQTGVVTNVDTNTTIDDPGALVGEFDQEFVNKSGGKYTLQDRQFRILSTEMAEQPPVKGNFIIFDSKSYQISEWAQSGDLNSWDIICKLT